MRKSEVKHITAPTPVPDLDLELRFTHRISDFDGKLREGAHFQPDDWDNVRRLTANLYFAWDDKAPEGGCVYVGEFVNPKPKP